MALGYEVFSEALVQVGTGASNAFESAFFSESGVKVEWNRHTRKIMTDVGGSEIPAEIQDMGTDYTITGEFVQIDAAVLAKLGIRNNATTPIFGKEGSRGLLMGTGGYTFKLAVVPQTTSISSSVPWYFPTAILEGAQPVSQGTTNSKYSLRFYAWPFLAGTALTSKDVVGATRVLP